MRTLILLATLLVAVGCDDDGSDPLAPDTTTGDAAAPEADAGPAEDAMADAGPAEDAMADAGPAEDAMADAGPAEDAAAIGDGSPPTPDATPAPDATADAEPTADGAPPPDASPEPDAGPSPDAEVDPADVGRPEAECLEDGDCLGFARCVDAACTPPGDSPLSAVIVLNEILIDGAIDVDANDDGDLGALDDEFVELLNIGPEPVSLAGATLVESDILGVPRHTFPPDFTLPPGEAVVLFGGGSPSEALEATPGARFLVVNAQDPAFSNGLNLDDGGDTLRLLDADGDEVFAFAYGDQCDGADCPPVVADQSMTRVPDGMGPFAPHSVAGEGLISPGRRADGSAFVD